jgi:RNA polymerase sigma factor (sigma-70 family)
MEASSLTTSAATSGVLPRRMPLLRLQADERLIALMREGHDRAFEVLFNRYQSRLLAFCRRLVGSPQDAEDVLQEVFAAAHAAILADSRPINARPWLYRIARNRCMNHLRKPPTADGVDSMDVHPHENGTSTLERVQRREELRAIVARVHELPETQRTALALRAIDDLSYADIAQAMGTTLPSVKSLVVRARMSLAGARGARGALAPFGLLVLLRKLIPAKLGGSSGAGGTAGTAGSVSSAGGAAGTAGGVAAAGSSSITLGGVVSAANTAATGLGGALGAKAAVGVAAAAVLTAGAVSVDKMNLDSQHATARADRAGVSAIAGTTSGIGSSATSPPAGLRGAADTAGAAGSTASNGSGRGRGSTTGRPPVKPTHPVKLPATGKPAAGSGHMLAPGNSTIPAAPNGIGASLKPSKIKSVAPPGPRVERVVVDLPPTRPAGRPSLPKPPKLPEPPPTPRVPR